MELARFFDHTILKPDCTLKNIQQLCSEATEYHFAAVCVPPYFVKEASNLLSKGDIRKATVIGFPMGYSTTAAKVEEIKRAIDDGADELDVVINLCAVKSGNWNYVSQDIDRMTTAAHLRGKIIKVILETGLLQEEEIRRLCSICNEIRPDFVKTSTGFSAGGATVEVVQLLHSLVDPHIKIKASGGIRSRADAENLIQAGAQRLGSSSSVVILKEL